jgi:diacylglycerol kinase
MLFSTFFLFNKLWIFIPIFIVFVYIFTYFSILEDINGSELVTLFIIPILFTISYYLFYFLFPVRWLTRVPFIIIYGVSVYAILLTSNILNVGVEKSLQLFRAAFSVNYFYQTVIIFLFSNILFSFRGSYFTNALLAGIGVFPLSLQLYWSIKLNLNIERQLILYSFLTSVMISQIAVIASFIPFKPSISALILTSSYYSLTGLINAYLDDRLFKQTIREYLFVLVFVILISILTISW